MSPSSRTRRTAAIAAAAFSATMLVGAIGLRVGQDEPRLVRTAGVTAPLEETTTSTSGPAAEAQKVAELDATVENHETRISQLEVTTTTTAAPAGQPAPTTTSTVPPEVTADPSTSTTATTPTTQPPTTTTTRWLSAGMCPADHHTGLNPDGVYCAAPPA